MFGGNKSTPAIDQRKFTLILLVSAFLIAASGLGFEIVTGTLASYLLGDSATQFSLTIGIYLFAMGIGSYLSKFIEKNILHRFIEIEILVGLIGGLSAIILFLTFAQTDFFSPMLWLLLLTIGILVGIEIPLLLRILKDHLEFKDLVSRVLSLDYIGGLGAAILIPVFLTPKLGLARTALLFGILNILVSFACIAIFRGQINSRRYFLQAGFALALLLSAFFASGKLVRFTESRLYADNIVYAKTSLYQRIVLTKWTNQFSLFLNNNLQFNSVDEYRYHEALVYPALLKKISTAKNLRALVLGGGDGLAIRELLKAKQVKQIDLVELDPQMIELARDNPFMRELNANSLHSNRVETIIADAFIWLGTTQRKYDLVIIDFPDPNNFSLGKLYSETFYYRVKRVLKAKGIAVTQATSPLFARNAFWCINSTIRASQFRTYPYHVYVPSFGEWGFILFSNESYIPPKIPKQHSFGFRFLTQESLAQMFHFAQDMNEVPTEVQRLNSQKLVSYYTKSWNAIIK